MKLLKEAPDSREYEHDECGTITVVDGEHLPMLSHPLTLTTVTFCVACDGMFPLEEFTWVDTGERISDSLERLAAEAPDWARMVHSRGGCLFSVLIGLFNGAVYGAIVGVLLGVKLVTVAGVLLGSLFGAIAGIIVWGHVVIPFVTRKVFGVSDVRRIR